MVKETTLLDSLNMTFKIFQLQVANKKPLSTKPAITQIENSCQKGMIFHSTEFCTTQGKCCSL